MEAAAPANVKIVHYQNSKTFLTEVGAKGKGFAWIQGQLAPTTTVTAKDSSSADSVVSPQE
jgi:hypothetical protein